MYAASEVISCVIKCGRRRETHRERFNIRAFLDIDAVPVAALIAAFITLSPKPTPHVSEGAWQAHKLLFCLSHYH